MFEKFASICICKYLVGVVGSHEVVGKEKVKDKGIINLPRIAASTNEVGFHAGPAYLKVRYPYGHSWVGWNIDNRI